MVAIDECGKWKTMTVNDGESAIVTYIEFDHLVIYEDKMVCKCSV